MKKRNLKTFFTITFMLCSALATFASQNTETEFKVKMQFGVNIAGAEGGGTAGTPNVNYIYPRAVDFDYFKSKGLTLVRIPFRWQRVQHTVGGPLDTEIDILKLKEVVKMAEDRGIKVMLDMHDYGRLTIAGTEYIIGKTDNLTIAHFVDVWTKLALEFKDFTNIWGYDLMNEPHDMGTCSLYKTYQAVVNGIRTVDTNTPIVLEGSSWASAYNWPGVNVSDSLKLIVDPSNKIIYEAHCYFDYNASGQYNNNYDTEVKTSQIALIRLKPFVDWLKKNNKVGMIGECGVPNNDVRWLTMLDGALTYLRDNDVSFTYWAAGSWWGGYPMSIQPNGSGVIDKVQMSILEKYNDYNLPAAVHEVISGTKISISPNPATDNIRIKTELTIKRVSIYNAQGSNLLQENTNTIGTEYVVSLKKLVSGTYLVKVLLEDNSIVVKKIVKI